MDVVLVAIDCTVALCIRGFDSDHLKAIIKHYLNMVCNLKLSFSRLLHAFISC